MPWCPKCKSEYKEGVTICPDCEKELVDSLTEESLLDGVALSEDERNAIINFLESQNFETVISEGDFTSDEDETLDHLPEEENTPKTVVKGAYQDSASKAEDNKSSGLTLLVVGFLGMFFLTLSVFGLIPFRLSGSTGYMTYGVIGALFVLFIVMGFISMRSSKVFAKEAETENTLKDAIELWCLEHFNSYEIDVELFGGEDITEEEKYFRRTSYMKKHICKQFINLNEDFLDHILDEIYSEIFE